MFWKKLLKNISSILILNHILYVAFAQGISTTSFERVNSNLNMSEDQTIDIPKEMKFQNLLVLGIGSKAGANYKIDIFRKLRPFAKNIYVCELKNNDLVSNILKDKLVDHF